jgi:hypothetical protein
MMKMMMLRWKRDNVADDEDDDAVRTSVSQDWVTPTLCTKELFLSTRYILYSSPHTSNRSNVGGGEDTDSQYDTLAVPARSPTSQLDLHMV